MFSNWNRDHFEGRKSWFELVSVPIADGESRVAEPSPQLIHSGRLARDEATPRRAHSRGAREGGVIVESAEDGERGVIGER